MNAIERPEMSIKTFSIKHGYQNHGAWKGITKEEAFLECRKWYGPRMPRWIELYQIEEITVVDAYLSNHFGIDSHKFDGLSDDDQFALEMARLQ